MSLQESGEMYLETIYVLSLSNEMVRSIDIANAMNYSKPSVSRAVHNLEDGGYLVMEDDGNLKLTDKGLKKAKSIYERHVFFSNYFVAIGVDTKTAIEDACEIEHHISEETFDKMKEHLTNCLKWDEVNHYQVYLDNRSNIKN